MSNLWHFCSGCINEGCPVKRGLNAFAKSINSCQPAQSAQTDMN